MKNLLLIITFVVFVSIPYYPIYAHDFENEEEIGATMHVDPNDKPIANEESRINFEFISTSNDFNLQECNCTVTIYKNGRQLLSEELVPDEDLPDSLGKSYIFPEEGEYNIQLTGKSLHADSFKEFSFDYPIRVLPGKIESKPIPERDENSALIWISVFIIIATLFIFVVIYNKYKKTV